MPDIDPAVMQKLEVDADLLERFLDGTRWSTCPNWDSYVRRALGDRAQRFGFMDEDNPTSEVANLYGGHDFAVADGRYIVDGLREVACMSTRVFDLDDPNDADDIAKFYGDRRILGRVRNPTRSASPIT